MSNEPDKVNSGALATVVVLLALAMLGVSLTITALVRAETGELGKERLEPAANPFRNLKAEQQSKLNETSWVDRAKGLVSIPIERAEKLMLGDIKRGHTWVGDKVDEKGLGGAGGAAGTEQAAPEGSAAPAGSALAPLNEAGSVPGTPAPGSPAPSPAPGSPAPGKAPEAPKAPAPEAPKQ